MSSSAVPELTRLRQHRRDDGARSPHKPLLVLLALGRLARMGSSALSWEEARTELAALLENFGPVSKTEPAQAAAYPFTRLRSDGVWVLDEDVDMDKVAQLNDIAPTGRLSAAVEAQLASPGALHATARELVEAEFPPSLFADVLTAAGLDPDEVFGTVVRLPGRKRSTSWAASILAAWDRQCAFCGFDGQLGSGSVGLDAAHVRWFNHDGPDDPDNGLALCSLHHRLFDRGALGLTAEYRVQVSGAYSARTGAGRRVYDLHDVELRPRPGTPVPASAHVTWHQREVFKGVRLSA
ncbi:phosphorothioated DNA-binding restriction endonuclease [Nocardioides sp. P5_E3]